MNRELWLRILQVAVVAPYVYHMSRETDSDYFRIGLKMVAAGIIITNARPLLAQAAPFIKVIADATAQASRSRILTDDERANAIDAEYVKHDSATEAPKTVN